ncbi:CcoQ/FixQ family Cbb3-type cytochrome c oxidase assembly chaperone [Kineobactrum sediminis]|uniref:CcoQ/FixQ family Cbb3-type cytochrome c oxidase assembly chaperone n=1 Tax=Kineobactrum sediminis TaxID=1905677 RepID=A0A2N5Y408_9GAMM|nr:cbb3-type cytochrome c oxidase subunit 3 [Kineobactrum sediminis]PLW83135.1 CcoQ/FixQ family Cbb3-type cytochrome c oxidase assembly chaperone [Kineobactrum sediminis]
MDINDLRGLSTILIFVSFVGLCIWVYSSKRKKSFEEAAHLPFADEEPEKPVSEESPEKPEQSEKRSKQEDLPNG